MPKNYWMVVQTPDNFEITRDMGFALHGLRSVHRRRAQRMEPDDRILYYVSGIHKWTAIATVTSRCFEDRAPVWNSNGEREVYPYRVKLSPSIVLDASDYIDAMILAPRLEYLKRWVPERWPLAFVETLHLLPQRDFRLIEGEMKKLAPRRRTRHRSGRNRQEAPHGPAPEKQVTPAAPGGEAAASAVADTGADAE